MSSPRFPVLVSTLVVVPLFLVVGSAGPGAASPTDTFGSHVASCAQASTGFTGQHNPSHHRGPNAADDVSGMHC